MLQKQSENLVEIVSQEKGQGSCGHTPLLAGKAEVVSDLSRVAHTASKRTESFGKF